MIVRQLTNDEPLDDYADVMALAFENYLVAVNAFRDAPGPRVDWIRRMVTGSAMARRLNGQPRLVAEIDGEVVGGAALRFSHIPPPAQPSD